MSFFLGTKVLFPPAFYGGRRPFLPYARARQAFTSFTCKQASDAPRWGLSGKVVNLGGWDGRGENAAGTRCRPVFSEGKASKAGRGREYQEGRFLARVARSAPKGQSAKKGELREPTTKFPAGSRGCPHTPWQGVQGGGAPPAGGLVGREDIRDGACIPWTVSSRVSWLHPTSSCLPCPGVRPSRSPSRHRRCSG